MSEPAKRTGGAVDPFDTPERRQLRELTRLFVEREVRPHLDSWERAGEVPRDLHRQAAKLGLLGIGFPEEVGGSGGDLLDVIVVTEELIQAGGSSGLGAALFTHGIALPHLVSSGDERLIEAYARPTLAGELIGALAITEPDGGSDVAGIRTAARRVGAGADPRGNVGAGADPRNHAGAGADPRSGAGDRYIVNGSKTYITSGVRADFVTTAVRTGDGEISLLVIDKSAPGFTVTRRLEKLGWHCSDTAELSFVDTPVPAANLVGPEGTGFLQLMRHFASERISLAVQAYATAQRCLDLTLAWTKERTTFGRPLSSRQVIRHRLAEMARRVDVARTYVRHAAMRVASGEPLVTEVAMAKNTAVEACDYVVDQAVQLHGGFGYLRDAEVERHYRDARIMGIGGGTTEIMNEIIAKRLGV
jgi:acyl-CoA dehydrogenase